MRSWLNDSARATCPPSRSARSCGRRESAGSWPPDCTGVRDRRRRIRPRRAAGVHHLSPTTCSSSSSTATSSSLRCCRSTASTGLTAYVGTHRHRPGEGGRDGRRVRSSRRHRLDRRADRQDAGLPGGRHRRHRREVPLRGRGARLRRRDQPPHRRPRSRRSRSTARSGSTCTSTTSAVACWTPCSDASPQNGRVVLCGSISAYNETHKPPGPANYINLISRRGRMEGFIALDHWDRFPEITEVLRGWVDERPGAPRRALLRRPRVVGRRPERAVHRREHRQGHRPGRPTRSVNDPPHHDRPVARRQPVVRRPSRAPARRTSIGSPRGACGSPATTRRPRPADRAGRRCSRACTCTTTARSATARRSTRGSPTSRWSCAPLGYSTRRCSATPTPPSTRARSRDPDDPRLRTYEGVLPGFERRGAAARGRRRLARVAARPRATTCPTRCGTSTATATDDPEAADRGPTWAPVKYAVRAHRGRVPRRALRRVARAAATTDDARLVRPRHLPPSPPAVRGAGAVARPDRPGRRAAADPPRRPRTTEGAAAPDGRRRDVRRRDPRARRPSATSASSAPPTGGCSPRSTRSWAGCSTTSIATGDADDTLVVLTADHGEQLADHWLTEKLGYFDAELPHPPDRGRARGRAAGAVVDEFTENVDLMPTDPRPRSAPRSPTQCDGMPLQPFLEGGAPERWRDAAHWEWDYRDPRIAELLGHAS